MNHYSVAYMTDAFETRKNTQASMYTLGVAGVILLLFILWKIPLPIIDRPILDNLVEINLNIPEEIAPTIGGGGGGGGGNPVQAIKPAGTAYSPPQAIKDEVKDIPDEKDTKAPTVIKPDVVKPKATKINNESAVVKAKPKEVIETPAVQKPKATLGKTIGGSSTGGGAAENYDRAGGRGGGNGVGDGNGNNGGSGNGNGGGNGPGTGPGTGPKNFGTITKAINQSFEDEFNETGKVAMDLVVNERGKVVSATFNQHGSTTSNPKLISIAQRRAFELNLGSSPNGQKGTVIFNLKVKG